MVTFGVDSLVENEISGTAKEYRVDDFFRDLRPLKTVGWFEQGWDMALSTPKAE